MPHRTWLLKEEPSPVVYDLLTRLIVPRPIAFVSTVSKGGEANLAPFSFFVLGGASPASLAFCPIRDKQGHKKATLRNIEETRQFTVNLVTRDMAEGMNQTGVDYVDGTSKWGISGFTHEPSQFVVPDRVEQSPVQFECTVHQIVEHGDAPYSATYVIGEILAAHLSESLFEDEDGRVHRFSPIARLGGREYIDLDGGKVFEMTRPKGGG